MVSGSFTVVALAPSFLTSTSASRPTTSLSGYVNIEEYTQRNLQSFEKWASSCNVRRGRGFQLTTEDGMDFSVMTSEDIPAGQSVLTVPANMILSSTNCQQELFAMSNGGLADAVELMGRIGAGPSLPEFYLTLKLLVEYERGDRSKYFAWLDSLPRLYYNAVSMTDFCYECLPPLVFSLSREERLKFDNLLQVIQKVDVISDDLKREIGIMKWAFNAVHTRCLDGPNKQKYLVPMADMFNHGTETEVEISFDDRGNCQAYTTVDVPAGYPLRRSYGSPTNPSPFFAKYGFLDDTSPATFCKMMNIHSTPELVNLGYDFNRMLFYRDTGEISEEVWDVVLYDKVLRNNPNVRQQFYEAHMMGDGVTKEAIHQQYYLQTASEIKLHVDTFLYQLDELSNKAMGKSTAEHPRLPLILSHNDFVRSTFLNVRAYLDSAIAQSNSRGSRSLVYN